MSAWGLPTTVKIAGAEYKIRSDFRAVLDAITALGDPELSHVEQQLACLEILYPDWAQIPDPAEAMRQAMQFINVGRPVPENQPAKPQLVDWDKDVDLIAPAVDRVLGFSCRQAPYLHWWEFVGAYSNIGRGLFAEVVGIRAKRAKGKKLEKYEQEFVQENPDLVSMATPLTSEEEEFFKALGV